MGGGLRTQCLGTLPPRGLRRGGTLPVQVLLYLALPAAELLADINGQAGEVGVATKAGEALQAVGDVEPGLQLVVEADEPVEDGQLLGFARASAPGASHHQQILSW